ncbi:MAG: glutamine amidotransferase [Fibrobacteria bacterium]|jgi:glucosamine--fructose-6-phosphate aminotransferase (isomerizing)|nr:glutamine amidotransferase [Fibrobacteria bacterium]
MCGIVAYTGGRQAVGILIEGLRKLEYRGYDSAGVCLQDGGRLNVVRAKGRLSELETALTFHSSTGTTGIGHTRWATHGAPEERNAHPHSSMDGRISVVHNGIIENYALIKSKLKKEGVVFKSDTDTEVIAHLVSKFYKDNLASAVADALTHLEGAFGIVVISANEPGVLIGARRGSPLVLGVGEDECILASDASAIVEHTQKVIYLDENDMVEIKGAEYRITNQARAEVRREIQNIEFSADQVAKGNFEHFMLKEIFEQPEAILNSLRGRLLLDSGTANLQGLNLLTQELRGIHRIVIIACGTSFFAGKVGEYLIEEMAGIPVEVEYASEFRYRNPILEEKTIVFAISQSGETADTLAALREAKRKGATVLGICNAVGSSIARETDGGVYLHAGPEIGVASTKAFTCQVTVLTLIALLLGRMRHVSAAEGLRVCNALQAIPGQIREILAQNDAIREIARQYVDHRNFLYLGRGFNYPVALEGALKLKEISYVHAEGYPAAEMKHGPIALIDADMPTVVVCPSDVLFDKVISNMQEVKARGGRILAVTDSTNGQLEGVADHVIRVPKTLSVLTPLLHVVPLQLLAYHIAVLRGCDVDMPRNLAKSVTVE